MIAGEGDFSETKPTAQEMYKRLSHPAGIRGSRDLVAALGIGSFQQGMVPSITGILLSTSTY